MAPMSVRAIKVTRKLAKTLGRNGVPYIGMLSIPLGIAGKMLAGKEEDQEGEGEEGDGGDEGDEEATGFLPEDIMDLIEEGFDDVSEQLEEIKKELGKHQLKKVEGYKSFIIILNVIFHPLIMQLIFFHAP